MRPGFVSISLKKLGASIFLMMKKKAVKNWLKAQPTKFYKASIHALIHQWTVVIEKDGNYIEIFNL